MLFDFIKRLFKPRTHKIGAWAERKAAQFLKAKGVKILHRNWRAGQDELDLIGVERRQLVFVEVRARHTSALVSGAQTLSPRKHTALRRAVLAYLRRHHTERTPAWRFDVVEISYKTQMDFEIYHYPCVKL